MDTSNIFKLTYDLKDALKNTNEYKELLKCEKEMLEDNNTFILLNKYQEAQSEYKDALRFKEYESKYKEKQEILFKIKYEVDTNPYVIKYNEAYKVFNNLLKEIEEELFKGIITKKEEKTCE